MDRNETSLNDSIQEQFKDTYCKDVNPILIKNAADHSRTLKITLELKREHLKCEHAQIDEKIAGMLKRIDKSQQLAQDLDREIYNATELKNQSIVRFERTGQMIDVLKDETEKIKNRSKSIETRRLELEKKVNLLTEQKTKNKNLKKKIEELEVEIKSVLNAPEPELNQHIVEENIALKKKFETLKENFEVKRAKKQKIVKLKDQKLLLLQQVYEKHDRNRSFKEDLERLKEVSKEKEQVFREKLNKAQESFDKDTEKRNQLIGDFEKSVQRTEELAIKTKDIEKSVAEKETEIKNLKEKIQMRQNYLKDENDLKTKQYESEVEKLKTAEEKLQQCLNENKKYLREISEVSEQIINLKEQKGELVVQLYNKKTKLTSQQYENAEKQNKIASLSENLTSEAHHVEELKTKNHDLEKKLEKIESDFKGIPFDLDERRKSLSMAHKEKVRELIKQQDFQKATLEILQLKLDENSKKIETLQKELKENDDGIKWKEMRYGIRKQTADKLQEKAAKEQEAYEKLVIRLKQKIDDKKQSQKPTITDKGNFPVNKILHSPAMAKPEEKNTVESEEGEDNTNGRKSPGILKSPFKKPNQQANKRVTFEGLSSTESSSTSEKSPEKVKRPLLEGESIEELLQDWATTGYSAPGRRALDF